MRLLYFPLNIFFNQDWLRIVRGRNNLAAVKRRKSARLILQIREFIPQSYFTAVIFGQLIDT